MNLQNTLPFEPFRMKVIEEIPLTTWEERKQILIDLGFNPLKLNSSHITIDLLTDSGLNGLSKKQMAGLLLGDESYGGSTSYSAFIDKIKSITGFEHVLPVHQGRAAENILLKCLSPEAEVIYSNGFFDSTRVNTQRNNFVADTLFVSMGNECEENDFGRFKGNIDIHKLEEKLKESADTVGAVILTITNNARWAQPVSMKNIKDASALCRQFNVKLIADACRFAENAWAIKHQEDGYGGRTVADIVREMFSFVDVCYVSARKDGISNTGGFLALSDTDLYNKCRLQKIPVDGGVAGRDYESMIVGFSEVLDERYLSYRKRQVTEFGNMLTERGIPIWAIGTHAIYIDAEKFFPHMTRQDYPAWTLTCELFLQGGIRSVESGNLIRGKKDSDETFLNEDLVRLAIPRRVYTLSHLRFVADVLSNIMDRREEIQGMRIAKTDETMRAFTLAMEPKYSLKESVKLRF